MKSILNSFQALTILFKCAPVQVLAKCIQVLLVSIMTPFLIFATQNLIEAISAYATMQGSMQTAMVWLAILAFTMFFTVGSGFFDNILLVWFKKKANPAISSQIVEKFKRLNYACFEDTALHNTIQRMGEEPYEKIIQVFLNLLNVLSLTIILIGATLVFAQISVWFCVGFIVMIFPMIFLNYKGMDKMNDIINEQTVDERKLTYISQILSNKVTLYELRVFRAIPYILKLWRKKSKQVFTSRLKVIMSAQWYFIVSTFLFIIWVTFIAFVLAELIINRHIAFGLFTALILSISTVITQSQQMSYSISTLTKGHHEVQHYYRFLSLPDAKYGNKTLTGQTHSIRFEEVWFTYPNTDTPVLRNLSFEIKPKERLAIVGVNGAGKTTIIKLLLQMYHPDQGRITIDGIDMIHLSKKTIQTIFSVIFQDYTMYYLTLRENVALGNIERLHDDAAIYEALEKGMASDIATMMGTGLDTNLGKLEEDGQDLSKGQWQRIALSRSLFSDTSFVILDEPTASMDPIAESEMYSSFDRVLRSRGYLMISHRLASAKMADRIIVLNHGAVAESGSHEELMKRCGLYSEMFLKQSEWYQGD